MAVLAIGIGLPAFAKEQRTPQTFPYALLSDEEIEERSQLTTDPGVMGEVEVVRQRYPDGKIHIERQMTLDNEGNYVNHGSWKMYAENGDVMAEGQYQFGRRVGLWTRWHARNDSPLFSQTSYKGFKAPFMSQANFTDGVMDGEWLIIDANDRKCSQISLKNGQRHGLAITWLANGSTFQQSTYEHGQQVGELLETNAKTGKLAQAATFIDGRKLISKIDYYRGNKQAKKSETSYLGPAMTLASPDEFWNVRFAKYTGEGKQLRHGVAKTWYPNGKLEFEGAYQYGKKSGTFTFWHENGQVAATGDYRDDLAEGQWVWWHENGQKSAFGRYQDGHLIGEWRWWNESGKLTKQQTYDGSENVSSRNEEAIDISSLPEFGSETSVQ
jgi:antitoxin component YwqK of YwqJK toxin-antitoxin module